eukprot:gene789-biopygen670
MLPPAAGFADLTWGELRVTMEKVPMTGEGYTALDVELKRLKTIERPAVIAAIGEARLHGDLSENAEYHAAKDRTYPQQYGARTALTWCWG